MQVRALKNKCQSRYNHCQLWLQGRLSGWGLQDIKYFVSLSKLVNTEKGLELILTKSAFSPTSYFNTLQLGKGIGSFIYASSSSL